MQSDNLTCLPNVDTSAETLLNDERKRMSDQLAKVLDEIKKSQIWSPEWQEFNHQQTRVSTSVCVLKFLTDVILLGHKPYATSSPECRDLIEQVQNLCENYDQFKARLSVAQQTHQEIFPKLEAAIASVRQCTELIRAAKTLEELRNVVMPATDEIQKLPEVPEVTEFVQEWQQMDLEPRIDQYTQQVSNLITNSQEQSSVDSLSDILQNFYLHKHF